MTNTYDARLATRLTRGVDARLRQLALASRRPISHVLDDVLDAALPAAGELADRLRQLASAGHDAGTGSAPAPATRARTDDGPTVLTSQAPRGRR